MTLKVVNIFPQIWHIVFAMNAYQYGIKIIHFT